MLRVLVSLLPVFVFLAALIFLDSYKLVKLRAVLSTIFLGCVVAAILVGVSVFGLVRVDNVVYPRYGAPVIEELLKGMFLVYLIRSKKIGFMVDAAIYGFAIGAGFAFVENIHYLGTFPSSNILLWIIRGFGTAVMHGGTTALFGIVSKSLSDQHASEKLYLFIPGITIAILIHSLYNHFFFSPQLSAVIILIALPVILLLVFDKSERMTSNWLGVGFDSDAELLELITTGEISESRIGMYLKSLKTKFPGEVVADMLCLLRIHVELSMRAKGILLMRGVGFRVTPDPEIKEKFAEMAYLEKSIGKTGHLAILPFLHKSSRELWQLYMLGKT